MAEAEDVVGMVMDGYGIYLRQVAETPWADAMDSIEYLEDFDDLNDSDLIDTFAKAAPNPLKVLIRAAGPPS
jgi:hypothetical protein